MSAPERIWAWPKGSWFTAGASDRPVKAAGALDVEYIRADAIISDPRVKAMHRALEMIAEGYGPNHLSKFARDTALSALKGAQT